jgi:predicted DNA-binding transcriptional regulator YafY
VSKTERLLELLVLLRTRQHFTAQELADEFGVSRRTMLRDMQALSLLGVPLVSSTGSGGGYTVDSTRRTISLQLTVEEAIGLVMSYEAFLSYRQPPFGSQSRAALTKLRAAMSPDVVVELDRLRKRVATVSVERAYEAAFLQDLLQAARDGVHLQITYESRTGGSERLIYPYGLYAGLGFWYCACFDYRRGRRASLRADRIQSLERVEGLERPPEMTLQEWLRQPDAVDDTMRLQATITARGMKDLDWSALGPALVLGADGHGEIDTSIPAGSLDHYARVFLPLGNEATITSPTELVALVCKQARAILAQYRDAKGNAKRAPD